MTNVHYTGSVVDVTTNLGELFDLVRQAQKDSEKLEQTLNRMLDFEAKVSISAYNSSYISPVYERPIPKEQSQVVE